MRLPLNNKSKRRGIPGAFGKCKNTPKPKLTPAQLNKLLEATGYYNFDAANAVLDNNAVNKQ